MSSRTDTWAERRAALVAHSDQNRAALSASFGEIERRLAFGEIVVATARTFNRHRALLGAAAAWMVFAPRSARKWLRLGIGLAPVVVAGYRLFRSTREAREAPPASD